MVLEIKVRLNDINDLFLLIDNNNKKKIIEKKITINYNKHKCGINET